MASVLKVIQKLYYSSYDFTVYEPYFNLILGARVTNFLSNNWFGITKTLFVLLYYMVGILYYNQIEGWIPVDCIYFITVTVTTVGYGFFHPTSDSSRVFTCFFMLFGVIMVLPMANVFAEHVGIKMQNELLYLLKATKNQWIVDNVNRGVISIVAIFLCYYIGIAFYTSNEDFTFATAMYFTTQTMTTVGYGDIELMHASSRWFGIVFIITCVLIFATALNNFGIIYGNIMMQRKRAILLTSFTGEKLKALAKSEKGIDKYEFVLEILVETGAIDRDMDVAPLLLKFAELDSTNAGVLKSAAIERFVAEAEEVTRLHAESNAPYPRSGSIPPELQTESAFRDVIRHRSSDVYTAINPMARIPETTEHRSLENQGSEADDRFVEIDVEGNPSKHGV